MTLDLIFSCRLTELPQMQAADDLEQLLWIDRDDIVFEDIAFSSLRLAVRRYLESDSDPPLPTKEGKAERRFTRITSG